MSKRRLFWLILVLILAALGVFIAINGYYNPANWGPLDPFGDRKQHRVAVEIIIMNRGVHAPELQKAQYFPYVSAGGDKSSFCEWWYDNNCITPFEVSSTLKEVHVEVQISGRRAEKTIRVSEVGEDGILRTEPAVFDLDEILGEDHVLLHGSLSHASGKSLKDLSEMPFEIHWGESGLTTFDNEYEAYAIDGGEFYQAVWRPRRGRDEDSALTDAEIARASLHFKGQEAVSLFDRQEGAIFHFKPIELKGALINFEAILELQAPLAWSRKGNSDAKGQYVVDYYSGIRDVRFIANAFGESVQAFAKFHQEGVYTGKAIVPEGTSGLSMSVKLFDGAYTLEDYGLHFVDLVDGEVRTIRFEPPAPSLSVVEVENADVADEQMVYGLIDSEDESAQLKRMHELTPHEIFRSNMEGRRSTNESWFIIETDYTPRQAFAANSLYAPETCVIVGPPSVYKITLSRPWPERERGPVHEDYKVRVRVDFNGIKLRPGTDLRVVYESGIWRSGGASAAVKVDEDGKGGSCELSYYNSFSFGWFSLVDRSLKGGYGIEGLGKLMPKREEGLVEIQLIKEPHFKADFEPPFMLYSRCGDTPLEDNDQEVPREGKEITEQEAKDLMLGDGYWTPAYSVLRVSATEFVYNYPTSAQVEVSEATIARFAKLRYANKRLVVAIERPGVYELPGGDSLGFNEIVPSVECLYQGKWLPVAAATTPGTQIESGKASTPRIDLQEVPTIVTTEGSNGGFSISLKHNGATAWSNVGASETRVMIPGNYRWEVMDGDVRIGGDFPVEILPTLSQTIRFPDLSQHAKDGQISFLLDSQQKRMLAKGWLRVHSLVAGSGRRELNRLGATPWDSGPPLYPTRLERDELIVSALPLNTRLSLQLVIYHQAGVQSTGTFDVYVENSQRAAFTLPRFYQSPERPEFPRVEYNEDGRLGFWWYENSIDAEIFHKGERLAFGTRLLVNEEYRVKFYLKDATEAGLEVDLKLDAKGNGWPSDLLEKAQGFLKAAAAAKRK